MAGGEYQVYEEMSEYVSLGMEEMDICRVVARLAPIHAYKTMPSARRPGAMQDVYKVRYRKIPLYIKFDLMRHAGTGAPHLAITLSFKRDTSV